MKLIVNASPVLRPSSVPRPSWSANLQTGYHRAEQLGVGTLLGRTTGERFTMSFAGQGFVVVQPSEEPPGGLAGAAQGQQQQGGVLGQLFS